MRKHHLLWFLIIVIVIGAIVFFMKRNQAVAPTENPDQSATTTKPQANADWKTYTSAKYHVSFQYPPDWVVHEEVSANLGDLPIINIYKKSETRKLPFIHQDPVTNVSIFPAGVPTEGVWGKTVTSAVNFKEQTDHPMDYVLQSGERYATISGFKNPPAGWESYGFAWARVAIRDEAAHCVLPNGTETTTDHCGLGAEYDGQYISSGSIDRDDRATEVKILESLLFTASQ